MNKQIEHMHKNRAAKGCFTFHGDERKHLSTNKPPTTPLFFKKASPPLKQDPHTWNWRFLKWDVASFNSRPRYMWWCTQCIWWCMQAYSSICIRMSVGGIRLPFMCKYTTFEPNNTLQHPATHCNTLQHTAYIYIYMYIYIYIYVHNFRAHTLSLRGWVIAWVASMYRQLSHIKVALSSKWE